MNHSEVQRTLVKSPPELWAELSDPGSLARHLGGLGEIRITSVEPESRVEWEGDGVSGAIALEPSGWGTKVTLTVSRTAAEPLAGPATATGPGHPGTGAGEEAGAATTPSPASAEPERPPEPLAADGGAPTDAAPEDPQAAGPAAGAPDAPEAPMPSPDPARGSAPAAAGEEGQPQIARDESAPQASGEQGPAPAVETLAAEEPPAEEPPAQVPTPPTRRGFFARLFGRRRAAGPRPGASGLPAGSEPEVAPTLSALLAAEAGAALTERSQPAPAPEAEAGDTAAVTEAATRAPAQEPPPESEPAAAETVVEPEPAEPEQPAAAGAPELEPGAGPETSPGADAAAEAAPPSPAAPDLSAELLAAEQSEEEQLRAILRGVLDRLGAAHHRPFSRA